MTPRFGGEYSIQLSYGTICLFGAFTAALLSPLHAVSGVMGLFYIKPLAPYNPYS